MLALADQEGIYRAVLHFYRPAGPNVRWLDPQVLPVSVADTGAVWDRSLMLRLIDWLGPARFCLQDAYPTCAGRSGGVLRVSPIYGSAPGRARLIVAFEGVGGPYAPSTAYSGLEVFLVEQHGGEWRIRTHAPSRS